MCLRTVLFEWHKYLPSVCLVCFTLQKASWFAPWVSKTECTLSNVFGWGAESIVFIGIKPESGKNFATEEEWPVLEKYIQAALKINPGEKGHIRGTDSFSG